MCASSRSLSRAGEWRRVFACACVPVDVYHCGLLPVVGWRVRVVTAACVWWCSVRAAFGLRRAGSGPVIAGAIPNWGVALGRRRRLCVVAVSAVLSPRRVSCWMCGAEASWVWRRVAECRTCVLRVCGLAGVPAAVCGAAAFRGGAAACGGRSQLRGTVVFEVGATSSVPSSGAEWWGGLVVCGCRGLVGVGLSRRARSSARCDNFRGPQRCEGLCIRCLEGWGS